MFKNINGVFVAESTSPQHNNEDYDESGFDQLVQMQRDHFWYRGRHAFIHAALKSSWASRGVGKALDLGGGCSGWLEYLYLNDPHLFETYALADSSFSALNRAESAVGSFAKRYQVNLTDLPWVDERDVIFLLDVLEHIEADAHAIEQAKKALRPGGLLLVTTPALNLFWTYNDDLALHRRRYNKTDFKSLAQKTGLTLIRADYFMFFLSPVLLASRAFRKSMKTTAPEERRKLISDTHKIPWKPLNNLLDQIFSVESKLINRFSFPWGTSILGIFRK